MPINSFLYPGAKFTPPYQVANSLRFNDGSSEYLERDFSTTQDSRRKFTFSAWVKRGALGGSLNIWGSSEGSGEGYNSLKFESDDLQFLSGNTSNSGTQVNLVTNAKFRDTSAWLHVVLAVDSTDGTESNRIKIYVNGSQITSFSTSTYPSQNTDILTSTTPQQTIGMRDLRGTNAQFFDGYMCEVVFIDNQQLTPTSFGEFDSNSPNIWKPKSVSGLTFGTGGYYLEFKQSGTSQNSSGLGADTSGNDQHFAVSNLTTVDQSTDTCTNNGCTIINASSVSKAYTLSEGNLKVTASASNWYGVPRGNIGVSSGKWYFEVKVTDENDYFVVGYMSATNLADVGDRATNGYPKLNGFQSSGYIKRQDGTEVNVSSSFQWYDGDIAQIALDMDNKKLWVGKAGSYYNSGNPASGSNETVGSSYFTSGETYLPAITFYATNDGSFNFGSPPYSESGGNSDANGYGNFNQSVPSGYYALNSKNLAEFG